MKKQKIQILILLVLCIVCVGGYFIIRNHTFETEEETVSVDVTNFNKDDVTELIISGDHEVHLVKMMPGRRTACRMKPLRNRQLTRC